MRTQVTRVTIAPRVIGPTSIERGAEREEDQQGDDRDSAKLAPAALRDVEDRRRHGQERAGEQLVGPGVGAVVRPAEVRVGEPQRGDERARAGDGDRRCGSTRHCERPARFVATTRPVSSSGQTA